MRIRSKSLRRLSVVALVGFLLVGGAGGVYVYRKARIRRQYQAWLAEALAAAQAHDNQRAVERLKPYLGRYPDDPEALRTYARVRPAVWLADEPESQRRRETIFVLRRLLKLEPDLKPELVKPEREQLLDLYVQGNFWTEALDTANYLLPEDQQPGKGDLPAVAARARALAALGEYRQALGAGLPAEVGGARSLPGPTA